MGLETERKFLVKGDFSGEVTSSTEILQAYLVADNGRTVRLRISGEEALLTVKGRAPEGSISRGEWEYSIPRKDAQEMLPLCMPGRIYKTRYKVPSGDHIFEVDVFHDRNEGLIIAEIELESEDEDFLPPSWLGEEVTGNPAYYNSNLV